MDVNAQRAAASAAAASAGAGPDKPATEARGSAEGEASEKSEEAEQQPSQQSMEDAGSIVAYRAAISAASLTVDDIVAIALRREDEVLPEFAGIKRGADPTINMSWLLVGGDRVTGKYLEHQIFDFEVGGDLKMEAAEVAAALSSAPGASPSHRLILHLFTQFANLIASDPGKLPLGPILGYAIMTGVPVTRHTYADAFGREVTFVLPRDNEKGESMLPEIVKKGSPTMCCFCLPFVEASAVTRREPDKHPNTRAQQTPHASVLAPVARQASLA